MDLGQTCCRCSSPATNYWPATDLDIEPDYYCKHHLHEVQMEWLLKLYEA